MYYSVIWFRVLVFFYCVFVSCATSEKQHVKNSKLFFFLFRRTSTTLICRTILVLFILVTLFVNVYGLECNDLHRPGGQIALFFMFLNRRDGSYSKKKKVLKIIKRVVWRRRGRDAGCAALFTQTRELHFDRAELLRTASATCITRFVYNDDGDTFITRGVMAMMALPGLPHTPFPCIFPGAAMLNNDCRRRNVTYFGRVTPVIGRQQELLHSRP